MIVVHATVTDAVKRLGLEEVFEDFRTSFSETTGMKIDQISVSAGVVEHMTKPFGAMLTIEFLDRSVTPAFANKSARQAVDILSRRLRNVTQRTVLAYPVIRDTLPPVRSD